MLYALVIAVFLPMQPVQVQIQYVEEEADCARFGVRIIREYQREYENVNFMAVCKMVWEV